MARASDALWPGDHIFGDPLVHMLAHLEEYKMLKFSPIELFHLDCWHLADRLYHDVELWGRYCGSSKLPIYSGDVPTMQRGGIK